MMLLKMDKNKLNYAVLAQFASYNLISSRWDCFVHIVNIQFQLGNINLNYSLT